MERGRRRPWDVPPFLCGRWRRRGNPIGVAGERQGKGGYVDLCRELPDGRAGLPKVASCRYDGDEGITCFAKKGGRCELSVCSLRCRLPIRVPHRVPQPVSEAYFRCLSPIFVRNVYSRCLPLKNEPAGSLVRGDRPVVQKRAMRTPLMAKIPCCKTYSGR